MAAGCGACVVVSCQLIAGIDDRTLYDAGTTSDVPYVDGSDPCATPGVPGRPDDSTSSSTDSITYTAALSQVMLGDGGAPYYGFNLDGKCTCGSGPLNGDSCERAPGQDAACDDPNGIDDQARIIFAETPVITEDKLNMALQTGQSGVLIRIAAYNGMKDDANVTVTVYGSLGYDKYPAAPGFDGGDHWTLQAGSMGTTTNAWVANYVLVASLSFPIVVGSTSLSPVNIELDNGLITATLTVDSSLKLVNMNGMLGGRWDPAKFLPSLQTIPDPLSSDGGYLCGSDTIYQFIKQKICENLDVNTDPNLMAGQCNAVSMGLGFVALPALLGDAGTVMSKLGCGMMWTDSCN